MKRSVNFCEFCDEFQKMDRADQFSYEGKKALFGYLEEYEEETGQEGELDIIALCCEYIEYGSALEAAQDHGFSTDEQDECETDEEALEYLQENTQVIEFKTGIIIQEF